MDTTKFYIVTGIASFQVLLGISCNLIAIYIYQKKEFKSLSTTTYFIFDSILGILLTIQLPFGMVPTILPINTIGCKITIAFGVIFPIIKGWNLVISGFDRLASVASPHGYKFKNLKKFQLITISIVSLIVVLLSIPTIYFYDAVKVNTSVENNRSNEISNCQFPTQLEYTWLNYYFKIQYLLLKAILPFIIMLTLSIVTAWKVYESKRNFQPNRDMSREINYGFSLVTIDTCFIIFKLPLAIYALVKNNLEIAITSDFIYSLLCALAHLTVIFSVLVFIILNSIFRKYFVSLILCRK